MRGAYILTSLKRNLANLVPQDDAGSVVPLCAGHCARNRQLLLKHQHPVGLRHLFHNQ